MTDEEERAAIAAICEACEENLSCPLAYTTGCIPRPTRQAGMMAG